MKLTRYEYSTESLLMHYEFISVGPKGNIKKIVEYSATSIENVFNLAFGDYDEASGTIDDKSVTNNGDMLKVLATVASTVYAFTAKYPDAWIYAIGSNDARTRLYRIGIAKNLTEISENFNIYGLKNEVWEKMILGEEYDAFLIKRKEL